MTGDKTEWEKGTYSVSYDGAESTHTYTLKDKLPDNTDAAIALNLLEQIIERAEKEDNQQKALAIKHGKASNAIGESWMVFHLKALKKILEQ